MDQETIETLRHEITIQLLTDKKEHPALTPWIDELIRRLKAECCECTTDEQELEVLKRWHYDLTKEVK